MKHKAEKSRQSSSPWPFKTESLSENSYNTLRFGIGKPSSVFKFLVAKMVFSEDTLSYEEIAISFIVYEKLVEQVAADTAMRQKYGYLLFLVRAIFQSLDDIQQMPVSQRQRKLEFYRQYLESQGINKRYYYSIKGQNERNWYALVETRRAKRFPPKAYVGKGYGDNGTARNPALDASPGWKDVAMSTLGLNDIDLPSRSEMINSAFQSLRVHRQQLISYETEGIVVIKGSRRE